MKWWSGGLLVWALSLPALAQEKVALNTISRVEVKGFTIEISGSKKPSFTTFTMTDPPRLVIDLSEAVFSGVPSEMQVNNGTVTAVKTASYGSEDSAIARVLIGFAKEAETDITTEGDSKLVVRVLSVSEPKVATVDPPTDKEAVAKAEKERLAREKAEAEAVAKVEAERLAAAKVAAAKAEKERLAREKAEAEAAAKAEAERLAAEKAAAAKAEKERLAREKAEAEAAAKAEAERLAAEKAAAAKAEKERLAREKAEAEAAAKAEAERLAAEKAAAAKAEKERLALEKAEAEAAAKAEAERLAAEKAAAEKAEKERLALEKAEAKAAAERLAAEKAAAAKAEKERLAREKAEAEAAAQAEAERLAAERAAAARAEKARLAHEKAEEKKLAGEAEAPASKRRQLTFVGFKLEPASARVYVRTDAPARYRISESDGETVMVELENTVIKLPNNQRFLDTSFFDTAVALVSPVEGPDRSVRVAIKLKRSVPYQARQEGNEVVVEFQK